MAEKNPTGTDESVAGASSISKERSAGPSKRDDALPPIWNLREGRNPYFTGREEQLAELRSGLTDRGIVVLNEEAPPVGGVGKTQLAREYAYRYADDYQVVWWVQAEESGVLHFGYTQLMTALNLLTGTEDPPRHSVDSVRDYLAGHSGWLLVLDGLDNLAVLESLLPLRRSGHVIVTTLAGSIPDTYSSLALPSFTEEESKALLKMRAPRIDDSDAEAIASQMDHNPIILNLLASYIEAVDRSPGEILDALRAKTPEAFRDAVTKEVSKGILRVLVGVMFEDIKRDNPAAWDLVTLCAFLGPHDIPLFLLNQENEILSKRLSETVHDEAALSECIRKLVDFGLFERHDDSISMHELVQEAIRDRQSDESQKAWSNAAVRLVIGVFPFRQQYDVPIPECNRLLAHALAATQFSEEAGVARESSAGLLYHVALYLHGRGALEEAKTCYLLAIAIGHKIFPAAHPTFATRINSLGVVEHELGNLKAAQECFEKSFEICEALFGPLHEAVYTAEDDAMLTMPIRNLCSVLEELGDIEAAQTAYERAMKINLEVYGWNHPLVAECANRFGRTWRRLGRLPKARNCFEKAVLAQESAEESHNADLATYINDLAIVLIETNEGPLAYERLQQALRLDRNTFSGEHPAIARDLVNLGNACRLVMRFEEAEKCYKEAMSIVESTQDPQSPQAASLLNFLGLSLLDNNKAAQARTSLEQALSINEEHFGKESMEVVRNLNNLGRALDELKAYSQAMACYRRALSIVMSTYPEDLARQASIVYRMGRSLHVQGNLDEALEHLQRAMKLDTTNHGQQHANVARDAFAIGRVLADQGDSIVAMGHLTLSLDIYENVVGKSDPRARRVRKKLDELSR